MICVSWIPTLAITRKLLLFQAGYEVTTIVGEKQVGKCASAADLLILAHSVPMEAKVRALTLFREVSQSPVLSLLRPHQTKLPEADFGVEANSPTDFITVVNRILA